MVVIQGRITKGGQVIVRNVAGTMQQIAAAGAIATWEGRLSLPAGAQISVGEVCRLELRDGRALDFFLKGMPSPTEENTVDFQGTGLLQ
jgi:hypothetical protein